jgi:hypothetical protein
MKREGHPTVRQRLLANELIRKRIAFRAYQIFEERGRLHGYDKEDWQQAETEILSEWIAREESTLRAEAGYPEAVTGIVGAQQARSGGRNREKQAIPAKTANAANGRIKKSARAKTKPKAVPAQKTSSPGMKAIAEPEPEPRKKDSTGPKNRKKKAAAEPSSTSTFTL